MKVLPWCACITLLGMLLLSACMESEENGHGDATYQDPDLGISFDYPEDWDLESAARIDGEISSVDYTFRSNERVTNDLPTYAQMGISHYADMGGLPLEDWIRDALGDNDELLKIETCEIRRDSDPCLEIVDQAAWIDAGQPPIQTTVFISSSNGVYAVAWGQQDTFNFRETNGREILRTLDVG